MPIAAKSKEKPTRSPGLGPALVGAAGLEPGVIITDVVARRTDPEDEESTYFVGWIDSLRLSQVVFAPLSDFDQGAIVAVRSTDGYQVSPSTLETRRFGHFFRDHPEVVVPPVLLSGRSRWIWRPGRADRGEIHVYDSAAVIDGRCRIGGYALAGKEGNVRRDIEFVLLPSIALGVERQLYDLTRTGQAASSSADLVRLPDSQHPDQIVISTDWTDLEILSEPYVVSSLRGYGAMLDVRVLETGSVRGLYANAKSLSQVLEQLRATQRTLVGMRIRLRKDGDGQYAQYEVLRLP